MIHEFVCYWPIATKSDYGLHVGSEGVDRTCQRSGKAVAIDPSPTFRLAYEMFAYTGSVHFVTQVMDAGGSEADSRPMCPRSESYRLLEALCRTQAAITGTPEAKLELLKMAEEYKKWADWLDRQPP